ncbi:hypothetical protein AL066_18145 [Pseudomonas nunensis]|nr:hypothetical protein AM274_14865 [Pseudomonas nunensis]KPN92158.1 hypothetical protein AL066_18145 [Pseudomonas nunensis]
MTDRGCERQARSFLDFFVNEGLQTFDFRIFQKYLHKGLGSVQMRTYGFSPDLTKRTVFSIQIEDAQGFLRSMARGVIDVSTHGNGSVADKDKVIVRILVVWFD